MKFPKKKKKTKALKQISLQNLLKESPSSSSSPSFIKDLSLALPPGLFLMFTNGPVPRIRFSSSPPQSFHWQPRDLSVWRTTPDSSAAETNLRGTMDGTLLSQACDNTIPESWNRCSVSFAFHLSTSARPVLSLIRLPQAPLLAANEGKILSNMVFQRPRKYWLLCIPLNFYKLINGKIFAPSNKMTHGNYLYIENIYHIYLFFQYWIDFSHILFLQAWSILKIKITEKVKSGFSKSIDRKGIASRFKKKTENQHRLFQPPHQIKPFKPPPPFNAPGSALNPLSCLECTAHTKRGSRA